MTTTRLQPQRQPGPLVALLGGRVEQYYALTEPVPVTGNWGTGESNLWAEFLSAREPDTEVLQRYGKSNGWLDDQPAAITRKVAAGASPTSAPGSIRRAWSKRCNGC